MQSTSSGNFINSNNANNVYDHNSNKYYWEPHTSSIDFCETNYIHSSYIVEPHNVLSSLWGLTAIGIIGICYGNPTNELRFKVAYGILIITGLGSASLHATLHWIFQSSDELPMIYLVISAVYCCLELGDDTVPLQRENKDNLKYPWLPHIFVAIGIINTLVYFRFQQIYIVFLLTFVGMIGLILVLHVQIAWKQREILYSNDYAEAEETTSGKNGSVKSSITSSSIIRRNNARIALKFYVWHYIVFIFIATPVWIIDQFWCSHFIHIYDNMLPFVLKGCTLHVIWHAMAGLGAHTLLQFLVACRMSVLRFPCTTNWIFGIIPVVVSSVTVFRHKDL